MSDATETDREDSLFDYTERIERIYQHPDPEVGAAVCDLLRSVGEVRDGESA